MNKILTITLIVIATTIPQSLYAVRNPTLECAFQATENTCPIIDSENVTLDSTTCNNICDTCQGQVTLPTGYITSDGATQTTKMPYTGCPEPVPGSTTKYVTKCSCDIISTITCDTANGYSGTPTFNGSRFSGCTKEGEIIIGPKGCKRGEYLADLNCTPCPSFNSVSGTTQLMGPNKITDCYIPSGNVFTDNTGTYTLTDDCYYTE